MKKITPDVIIKKSTEIIETAMKPLMAKKCT